MHSDLACLAIGAAAVILCCVPFVLTARKERPRPAAPPARYAGMSEEDWQAIARLLDTAGEAPGSSSERNES
jgi:hypothetical protein